MFQHRCHADGGLCAHFQLAGRRIPLLKWPGGVGQKDSSFHHLDAQGILLLHLADCQKPFLKLLEHVLDQHGSQWHVAIVGVLSEMSADPEDLFPKNR